MSTPLRIEGTVGAGPASGPGMVPTRLVPINGQGRAMWVEVLRAFACDHGGPLGRYADEAAEQFVGRPSTSLAVDDHGRDLYAFTDAEIRVMEIIAEAVHRKETL